MRKERDFSKARGERQGALNPGLKTVVACVSFVTNRQRPIIIKFVISELSIVIDYLKRSHELLTLTGPLS